IAGGAAVGLAIGSKYTGAAALGVVGWAILETAWKWRSWRHLVAHGLALALVTAVVATLACPACVMRASYVVHEVRMQQRFLSTVGGLNDALAPALGWYGRPYLYFLVAGLPFALGWSFYLCALGGLAAALRRRDAGDRLLLVALIPYFASIGGYTATYLRYL